MLDHLRQRAVEALAPVQIATLSTFGPAELQATPLPCEAVGLRLYMLVPATSDHIVNLETRVDVVVIGSDWQLRGRARVLNPEAYPPDVRLLRREDARWHRLVEVAPTRLNLRRRNGWGYSETIDFEQ